MKQFSCGECNNTLYFENTTCLKCRTPQGFDPVKMEMVSIDQNLNKYCKNHDYGVCNWILPISSPKAFCISCSTNKTIPSLSDPENHNKWKAIEEAKHRVFYSLLMLKLNLNNILNGKETGLKFEFLASKPDKKVLTGHNNGLITLNIQEADPVERNRAKKNLNEKYRTLMGHFRHEIGHYYWQVLIESNPNNLQAFRELFGDERIDYGQALQKHYDTKTPENWSQNYVSEYATAHPWEDWAETWAHYMHIMDTAETAQAYGMRLESYRERDVNEIPSAYNCPDFQQIVTAAIPLFLFATDLNNGMGLPSFYPFQITEGIKIKLEFIHSVIRNK